MRIGSFSRAEIVGEKITLSFSPPHSPPLGFLHLPEHWEMKSVPGGRRGPGGGTMRWEIKRAIFLRK
jgi:hypothetical protein